MCEQGLHTKGQGAIVLHVIVVALGTECHLLISVDIPITETAKTGAISISWAFGFTDFLEQVKALIHEAS